MYKECKDTGQGPGGCWSRSQLYRNTLDKPDNFKIGCPNTFRPNTLTDFAKRHQATTGSDTLTFPDGISLIQEGSEIGWIRFVPGLKRFSINTSEAEPNAGITTFRTRIHTGGVSARFQQVPGTVRGSTSARLTPPGPRPWWIHSSPHPPFIPPSLPPSVGYTSSGQGVPQGPGFNTPFYYCVDYASGFMWRRDKLAATGL